MRDWILKNFQADFVADHNESDFFAQFLIYNKRILRKNATFFM